MLISRSEAESEFFEDMWLDFYGYPIEEMSDWYCFRKYEIGDRLTFEDIEGDDFCPICNAYHFHDEIQEPYVRETPKVGRNEKCPCGSDKKYKKCCGV
jgi:preprotein translocase subunit SecA